MTANNTTAARRAILVTGPASATDAGLALLRLIAGQSQTTIAGVFVEDLALLRAAALPVTQEIGRVSGALRTLELPALETGLRRQAAQLQARLAAMASELKLPWTFDISRGNLAAEALSLVAHADVILLQGFVRELSRPAGHRAAVGQLRAGTIAALFEPGSNIDRLLSVASALGGRRLDLWLPASANVSIAAMRQQIAAAPGPRSAIINVRTFAGTLADLPRAMVIASASALVLPAKLFADSQAALESLLQGLDLTLVLVN